MTQSTAELPNQSRSPHNLPPGDSTSVIVGSVVGSLLALVVIIIAAIAIILVVWKLMIKKHQPEKDSEITNTTGGGIPGYHNTVYDGKQA